jgi:Zn finger protein HypA/HybF involved in hydrogenase expression
VTQPNEYEGNLVVQKRTGIVQCYECDFWGEMDGFIPYEDTQFILFVCPECKTIEKVVNPDSL